MTKSNLRNGKVTYPELECKVVRYRPLDSTDFRRSWSLWLTWHQSWDSAGSPVDLQCPERKSGWGKCCWWAACTVGIRRGLTLCCTRSSDCTLALFAFNWDPALTSDTEEPVEDFSRIWRWKYSKHKYAIESKRICIISTETKSWHCCLHHWSDLSNKIVRRANVNVVNEPGNK